MALWERQIKENERQISQEDADSDGLDDDGGDGE